MAYLVFCIINVIIGGRNCVYSSSSSSSNTEPYPNPQRDRNDGSSSSDPPSCRTTHSCGSCLLPTNEEDNAPFTLYRHPSSFPSSLSSPNCTTPHWHVQPYGASAGAGAGAGAGASNGRLQLILIHCPRPGHLVVEPGVKYCRTAVVAIMTLSCCLPPTVPHKYACLIF